MNVLVLDNMVGTPGTLATAHTPLIGGAITSTDGGQGTVTANNRMRGQAAGNVVYANLPASGSYTIEADIYVASNAHGIGISLSGIILSYTISNGYWNLGGPGVVTGAPRFNQDLNAGETHKIKLVASGLTVTAFVDGTQVIQKTSTLPIASGPAGMFFSGTDVDATGYQFESYTVYETPAAAVDLDGTFLIDGGSLLLVGSDNEFYLLGLIDRIAGTYVRTATVPAQVKTLSGTPVGSAVTLSFVSGSLTVNQPNGQTKTASDGNYRGQLPAATALIEGTQYYVYATATSGSNVRVFRGQYTAGNSTQ